MTTNGIGDNEPSIAAVESISGLSPKQKKPRTTEPFEGKLFQKLQIMTDERILWLMAESRDGDSSIMFLFAHTLLPLSCLQKIARFPYQKLRSGIIST